MEMKRFKNDHFHETYYQMILPNGLTVFLMPKQDYSVTYGVLATKYGSLDNEFIPFGKNDYVQFPAGIAHFLEHKMFEMPNNEDVNAKFASFGADVNAYTTYGHTAYLFSTTRNVEESVQLLLDFVQTPAYTIESVASEKGIIEQELLMYLDNPNIRIMLESNKAMYKTNPVQIDIVGTRSSIKEITKERLDECYQTFYHPQNMCLVLVGKFNLDDLEKLIVDNQSQKKYEHTNLVKRHYYVEDHRVVKKNNTIKMDVIIPKISVNVKLGYEELSTVELVKKDYAISALMYQVFDDTSDFYQNLQKNEIINNSFDYDVVLDDTYGYINVTGDTYLVDEFIQKITDKLLEMSTIEVSQESFLRYKRITEAQILRRMNSVEYFANMLIEAHFHKLEMFENFELIKELSYNDVLEARKYFLSDAISVTRIMPK